MTYYTTEGSVRGCCGHRHLTEDAADSCIRKDDRECKQACGPSAYSDRMTVREDEMRLTPREVIQLEQALDSREDAGGAEETDRAVR
jgi:hypothetical protein